MCITDYVCVWVCLVSVTAHGASGGRGLYNAAQSKAGYVSATFYLSRDDLLGVIVGQQGHSACSKVTLHLMSVTVASTSSGSSSIQQPAASRQCQW